MEERVLEQGVDVNAPCCSDYVTLHHVRWEGLNRTALHFAGGCVAFVVCFCRMCLCCCLFENVPVLVCLFRV